MWIPEYLSKIFHTHRDKRFSRTNSRLFSVPHPKQKIVPWWNKHLVPEEVEKFEIGEKCAKLSKRISMIVHTGQNASVKIPQNSLDIIRLYIAKGEKAERIKKILRTAPHFLSREICDILNTETAQVSDISDKITVDNEDEILENMLLAVIKGIIFGGEQKHTDIKQKIWEHTFAAAIAIKHICKFFNVKRHHIPFLTALLHDIGRVSLLRTIDVCEPEMTISLPFFHLLCSELHEEAGQNIVKKIILPEIISETIANHHSSLETYDNKTKLRAILQVADICANHCGHGFAQYPDKILSYPCTSYLKIDEENGGKIFNPIPGLLIASMV